MKRPPLKKPKMFTPKSFTAGNMMAGITAAMPKGIGSAPKVKNTKPKMPKIKGVKMGDM